jgi:long-chain acyl-CoA synthetase
MFHITGMVLNAGLSLLSDTTLVLTHRFHPSVVVEAIREHGVTFTIGSITAFNALLGLPDAGPADFRSVKTLYSGGAPIPPATIARFQHRFGPYLHNVWGMTETTAAGIAVPRGSVAPVHAESGTLSIGVPMQNVHVRVIGPDGSTLAPGQEGELEFWAPQVVSGYWQNPAATEATFPGGRLRTGDVAVIDEAGWIYLVDRLKDLINTSGFKVWPREVEDVLYEHPAVFEAAVVGEPDDYRGETVVAYVSLEDGASVTPDDLVAFARERLAAYKRPRRVYVVDDLPKTATGKIRRRELRDDPPSIR